jgi:FKBP-type peptidyl-prolyl cis-trans isomerase FklB
MKIRILSAVLLAVIITLPINAQKNKEAKKEVKSVVLGTRMDSISYCLGILYGGNLVKYGFGEIKSNLMATGVDQMLTKQKPLFDEAQANEIVSKYAIEQQKLKGDKNLKEGKEFLEKNKTTPGVIVLPSGLQYKVLKDSTGPKPQLTDKVTVHYHGTLIDGKVFDSSIERGEPIQLNVNGVIEGWKEALQLMPTGSKWRLFIPSELAYGENPMSGGIIEPNMVLIFDVELLSIEKNTTEVPPQIEAQPQTDSELKK